MARRQAGGDLGEGKQHPSREKAEADIRVWMSLFLSPENCKLLLLILPSTHIQLKFRDHYVVWHWSDIEREEKLAFFVDYILCSLDLAVSNWSPPAIRNRRFSSSVPAQHALFSLCICHFFFLSCLLLASLSPPSFYPPFLLPSLPAFLPLFHKHLWNSQGVCTWQGHNKEVSWEQIHQLEFPENRWSPSKEFRCTACFSFGWFSEAEFRSSRFPNFKTQ